MSRDTRNREGLTFEEWVCAAGYAKYYYFGSDLRVRPYSESHTTYTLIGRTRPNLYLVRLDTPTPARHLLKPVRRTTTHYSARIRKAWHDGEDPTDHRAELETLQRGLRQKAADGGPSLRLRDPVGDDPQRDS